MLIFFPTTTSYRRAILLRMQLSMQLSKLSCTAITPMILDRQSPPCPPLYKGTMGQPPNCFLLVDPSARYLYFYLPP